MTPQTRRQLVTLVVLAVVLAGVLRWQFGESTPADAVRPASNSAATDVAGRRQGPGVADVHLEALKAPRADVEASDRNPFRFRPRPAPVETRAARPTFVPPPVPVGPPPPPPIPLKFFGLWDLPSGRVAMFRDSRGSTFYGKEGDIIEGQYHVLRIGEEFAELAYVDGRGRQTIRLSGQ